VIIEESSIDFTKGLNIITGETGSGKSLIFKALNLLLGERASSDLIRKGEKKAIIEAKFDSPKISFVEEILNDSEFYEEQEDFILRREFTATGGSRSFLNDSPISVGELKKVKQILLDYHGQHSTSQILHDEYQISILDEFSDHQDLLSDYQTNYKELSEAISSLKKFKAKKNELLRNLEFWKFRLDEILEVDPKEGEEKEINDELRIIEDSEMLFSLAAESNKMLYDSSKSAYQKINEAVSIFEKLADYDKEFENFIEDLNSALTSVREAGRYASDIKERIDFDPIRIEELRTRSSQLRMLSKKFGPLENILKEKVELEENINSAENFDEKIEELENKIARLKIQVLEMGQQLSDSRKSSSINLSKSFETEFMRLGLENAKFGIDFISLSDGIDLNEKVRANSKGLEKIQFQLSANKGQMLNNLANAASGGEMSRIMLALKKIMKEKEIDLLVFDEIDTGISGKTAAKVGRYIKELASDVQILAITHQPQIAAAATRHFLIEKYDQQDSTISQAKILSNDESIKETAKLFSGENLSEESIKSAEKLFGDL
jgi:DNA repair protein RecN (Recombination protein N)